MGGHPYFYVVPYDPNLQAALEKLREREFKAGRYYPVIEFPDFPITSQSPAPGARHASIKEVYKGLDENGTRSILDVLRISDTPRSNCAVPVSDDVLQRLYGTTQPTRAAVEANTDFANDVDRGHAVYLLLFEKGRPTEVMFYGYSFD